MKEVEILKSYSKVLAGTLLKITLRGPSTYKTVRFTISSTGKDSHEFYNSIKYIELKDKLGDLTNPCVYWFEISSEFDLIKLNKSFNAYKLKKYRTVPAVKKKLPHNPSNILYLGKVKKGLFRRILQHLGYTDAIKTQSLQLYHWAEELKLEYTIHVLEFEKETSNLVGVFEFKLAREMNPLLGRHTT